MSHQDNNTDKTALNLVAEVAKRLANGGLTPADVQALLEKKPLGESSLDQKIVATYHCVDFTMANFRETLMYKGQLLRRHRNGGGWVPVEQDEDDESKPFVSESSFVGPFAMVLGRARVTNRSNISDWAIVADRSRVDHGYITGSVQVLDDAQILDYAIAYGNARIVGTSRVTGRSTIVRGSVLIDNEVVSRGTRE